MTLDNAKNITPSIGQSVRLREPQAVLVNTLAGSGRTGRVELNEGGRVAFWGEGRFPPQRTSPCGLRPP